MIYFRRSSRNLSVYLGIVLSVRGCRLGLGDLVSIRLRQKYELADMQYLALRMDSPAVLGILHARLRILHLAYQLFLEVLDIPWPSYLNSFHDNCLRVR